MVKGALRVSTRTVIAQNSLLRSFGANNHVRCGRMARLKTYLEILNGTGGACRTGGSWIIALWSGGRQAV